MYRERAPENRAWDASGAPPFVVHVKPVAVPEPDDGARHVAALVLIVEPGRHHRIDPGLVATTLGLVRDCPRAFSRDLLEHVDLEIPPPAPRGLGTAPVSLDAEASHAELLSSSLANHRANQDQA